MSCLKCSDKGCQDDNRFRPGSVTMLYTVCWSSASVRQGGIIRLTIGSMKVGVDRMH